MVGVAQSSGLIQIALSMRGHIWKSCGSSSMPWGKIGFPRPNHSFTCNMKAPGAPE